jgi:chromate reductase, NAD(P)H dehydrogenase (quinone)
VTRRTAVLQPANGKTGGSPRREYASTVPTMGGTTKSPSRPAAHSRGDVHDGRTLWKRWVPGTATLAFTPDTAAATESQTLALTLSQQVRQGVTSPPGVSWTILAISGSLRRSSINSAILRAAAAAARDDTSVVIDDSVRQLPHFDPDLEIEPPETVLRFRAACEEADGVLLAVPEYTFGIPGSLKNALDWTVGSGSLYRKPITILDVAPPGRGKHARHTLDLVLRAHGAESARYSISVARSDRNAAGEVADPRIMSELRGIVAGLAKRSSAAQRLAGTRGGWPVGEA